jgi:hypothetical protein
MTRRAKPDGALGKNERRMFKPPLASKKSRRFVWKSSTDE